MAKNPVLQTVESDPTIYPTIPDPFDLASLRLNPSFLETAGVKKLLTTVPSRRPNPQDFFRVRAEPEFRESFSAIELRDDREIYLVRPEVLPHLINEVVYVTLFTCINRQGVVSLWPVKLPTPDGKRNDWNRSAREAAEKAMTRWIRLKANMSLGAYEMFEAECEMGEPEWPDLTFYDLLKISYHDRMITSLDHPVVKRLRGQT
jgi:uncharacterized protein YbdZ (MbtH family)